MKRTIVIPLAAVLTCFAVGAAAGNPVVGKWDLSATDAAGQVTSWTLEVKDDGGKLSGSLIGTEVTLPLVDPKLDGENFTFRVLVNELAYQVETRVDGKRLEGKYKGPDASGTIKASKQP